MRRRPVPGNALRLSRLPGYGAGFSRDRGIGINAPGRSIAAHAPPVPLLQSSGRRTKRNGRPGAAVCERDGARRAYFA